LADPDSPDVRHVTKTLASTTNFRAIATANQVPDQPTYFFPKGNPPHVRENSGRFSHDWRHFSSLVGSSLRETGFNISTERAYAGFFKYCRGETANEERSKPMEFVKIPRGSFMMGCSPGDAECYAEEKPAHRVVITREFLPVWAVS
jgi:formylglycine-generating enzyme required for sulfatase activity